MSKEVVVTINDNGDMVDDKQVIILASAGNMGFSFKEVPPEQRSVNLAELMGLGATPDDLIKLKASGLL